MPGRPRSKLRYSIAALILTAAVSCSLDYEGAFIAEDLSDELPDTVLYEFTHVSVENGRPAFRMSAEVAQTYGKRNETVLADAQFIEYDDEGGIASEGSAVRAIYSTDSDDAVLSGGIFVYSKSQKAEIAAESLSWIDKSRTLTGSDGEIVQISKDSGSELSGSGFSADMRTREFKFSRCGQWHMER